MREWCDINYPSVHNCAVILKQTFILYYKYLYLNMEGDAVTI